MEDSSGSEPKSALTGQSAARADLIQREIPRLAALVVVAIGAFFLTRAVAISNRDMNRRDAAEWYARGQQEIRAGNVGGAVDSFRRATIRDRNNRTYVPALAHALSLSGRDAEATRVLLALRETQPDNSEINLQLARLAAARHDGPEALRYYHYTLYSPSSSEDAQVRRAVRRELVDFLLAEHLNARAVPELLVLAADALPSSQSHIELGNLFVRAGDRRHALDQFQEALRLEPRSVDGLVGAAESAFELREYALARRYLHQAPPEIGRVRELRTIADLVVSSDPLAGRIGGSERRRRLTVLIDYTAQRLNACAAMRAPDAPAGDRAVVQEWESVQPQLRSPHVRDADEVAAAVDLMERTDRAVVERCPPNAPMDRALQLIAQLHRPPEEP